MYKRSVASNNNLRGEHLDAISANLKKQKQKTAPVNTLLKD